MTDSDPAPLRFCAICERSLVCVSCESVVADVCAEHGIFLDHGELAVLERRAKRGVRIGLHTSIARDMAHPFRKPVAQPDADGSLMGILSGLLSYRVQANHRPEQVGQTAIPLLKRDNQTIVPDGMRACPQCNIQMQADERRDLWGRTETIVVDTCGQHGVWLDHSELAILQDRSNQEARRNARRYRRRAIERARQEAISRGR